MNTDRQSRQSIAVRFKQYLTIASIFLLVSSSMLVNAIDYHAEIVRTSHGIPHITAKDFANLGFGEGYAAAEDQICNIAHGIVIARAEQSRYHGVGKTNQHYLSDVVIKGLEIPQRAVLEFNAQSQENKDWLQGYAAGYNRYLKKTGRENVTSWCQGADWLKPISAVDLFSRFQVLAQSAPRMAGMLVAATPPKINKDKSVAAIVSQASMDQALSNVQANILGSNGWAIGKDRTENGRGMLLSNPHYPWSGTSRFWEKHLTIPGKLDVYGVHLIGAPGVAIGFNKDIGWTHTVSSSKRVVFYQLDLVPGDPTSYFYDGKAKKMRSVDVSIAVKDTAGKVSTKTRTLWFSHYGPMVMIPKKMPWSKQTAFTIRDANFRNQNLLSQWKAMDLASSMDELKAAHKKWNALPWVNTIATSKNGDAVYIDGSNVGRLSDEGISLWKKRLQSDEMTKAFYHGMGLILLNGSDSRFEWTDHPDARGGSVVPFSEQPIIERNDYVFNSNDSYWLSNPEQPLSGYSPLYGRVATPRTLRTRMNALLLGDRSKTGPSGVDGQFSLKEMQAAIFSNRSLSAELLVKPLVKQCRQAGEVKLLGHTVDIAEACEVLAGYNGKLNLQSKGAVLFREWITQYDYSSTQYRGELFKIGFDVTQPINTPNTLANNHVALQKLAKAVELLNSQGIKLDATLGDLQFAYRGNKKIAVHGGGKYEGIANIIAQWNYDTLVSQVRGEKISKSQYLTDKGYPITFGTSFIMSLSYTDDGPVAEAILTYSESGDPSSKYYTDQTELFSKKQWRAIHFNTRSIAKDQLSRIVVTNLVTNDKQ